MLGLDISTRTGAVIVDTAGKALYSGVLKFDGPGFTRSVNISSQVRQLVISYLPRLAVVEGYAYGNRHTLALLVEIGTLVRYTLWSLGVPVVEVQPSSLKKFVTGKGNATKEEMAVWAYRKWRYQSKDHNEVDAYCLAMAGLEGHATKSLV